METHHTLCSCRFARSVPDAATSRVVHIHSDPMGPVTGWGLLRAGCKSMCRGIDRNAETLRSSEACEFTVTTSVASGKSDDLNLWLFQRAKSEPSTRPSALKSPALQAATLVELLVIPDREVRAVDGAVQVGVSRQDEELPEGRFSAPANANHASDQPN